MPLKLPFFLFILACALLFTCSDDNGNPTYPIERTILDVSVAKRCADCYLLRWQHPYETKDLQSYYVWIDTTVVNDSIQQPSQSQIDRAQMVIPFRSGGSGDSLILTDLISGFLARDSLYIAIWAKYSGSDQGMIRHYYIYFGDDVAPLPVIFSDSASANSIWVSWVRPTDQNDFYSQETNGIIAGYNVVITAQTGENISGANAVATLGNSHVPASKINKFQSFEKEGRNTILQSASSMNSNRLMLAIEDGEGYNINDTLNNWRLEISGLMPERSYEISIEAWDIAGNSSGKFSRVKGTTDTIAPSIAKEFIFDLDPNDGLPRLDSNRLVLKWQKSVDTLDRSMQRFRDVESYVIEQWSGNAWKPDTSGYDIEGGYVSHTLRYVSPGEEIKLRIRAVDSSGHYSNAWVDSFTVSMGEFSKTQCPENFMPVRKDSETVFCMEKFQHFNYENEFERNVLYGEAKRACEYLNFDGFEVGLCTEQEWNAACTSRGSSYGVIEETDFLPNVFLSGHCGIKTGDSISAKFVSERDRLCVSPDGIRDLPGQLQEWVIRESASGDVGVLKGTSYVKFTGGSIVELAQCINVSTPTRSVLRYADTAAVLKDTILIYSIKSRDGKFLDFDIVDKEEYKNRGGERWLEVRWQGLIYEQEGEEKPVVILGEETVENEFFLNPSVGFRCCANAKK
jgi:hypothetical protein